MKKKKLKKNEYITTYTGKKFHIFNPKESEINIKDISHALSLQCRFNGHTSCFYSVASHVLIGTCLIEPKFKKEFLCHENAEVVTGDLVTPIKRRSPEFLKMEEKIEKILTKKYGLPFPMSPEVKEMDNLMFRMEFAYLMNGKTKEKFPINKKEFMEMINKTPKEIEKELTLTFNKLFKK